MPIVDTQVDPAPTTLLRVRGGAELLERLAEPGMIRVSTREELEPGDPVSVEISFGALTDEVTVQGRAARVELDLAAAAGPGRREVTVRVDEVDEARLRYVKAVARGKRDASARAHRRVPASLPVEWSGEGPRVRSQLVDISRGGAFISRGREIPPVGAQIEVCLDLEADAIAGAGVDPRRRELCVRSRVAWVCDDGPNSGFGVEFRVADRDEAAMIAAFVRATESSTPALER